VDKSWKRRRRRRIFAEIKWATRETTCISKG